MEENTEITALYRTVQKHIHYAEFTEALALIEPYALKHQSSHLFLSIKNFTNNKSAFKERLFAYLFLVLFKEYDFRLADTSTEINQEYVECLIRNSEELNITIGVFAQIKPFLPKEHENLFDYLVEDYITDKHSDNFHNRLKVFVQSILFQEYITKQNYYNFENNPYQTDEETALNFLKKGEISDLFSFLQTKFGDDVIVRTYMNRYISNYYSSNDIQNKELGYLIREKYQYLYLDGQKNILISSLDAWINDLNIAQYFHKLTELGLQNPKLDFLKRDYILNRVDFKFYEELKDFAREASQELLQKAFEEKYRDQVILIQEFENTWAGSRDMFGDFEVHFQPQINLLLGRNGYGKTHFLRYLLAFLQNNTQIKRLYPSNAVLRFKWGKDNFDLYKEGAFRLGGLPVLAITDSRFMDKSGEVIEFQKTEYLEFPKDGAYFLLHQKPMNALVNNFFINLANLHQEGKFQALFDILTNVVAKLNKSETFKFLKFQNLSDSLRGAVYEIWVQTEASPNPLPLQKVSQGTMSVLVIFGLIYDFLRKLHPKVSPDELAKQWGIVFIDEIDAHLHPSWQRQIIPLLRETFPNVQFFLTAHSPLLVAGCFYGEVSVMLKNEEKGNFYVKNFDQHFLGADVEDLYTEVFGLENLKDENYLKYFAELPNVEKWRLEVEKLNEKETITPEERKKIDTLFHIWQVMKVEEKRRKELKEAVDVGKLEAELEILRTENEVLKQKLAKK